MDQAIKDVGGKPLHLRPLEEPKCGMVETVDPVACSTFAADACRSLGKGVKSITVLFDLHCDMAPCGDPARIRHWTDLPEPIRFKGAPADASKMDLSRWIWRMATWISSRCFTCHVQSPRKWPKVFAVGSLMFPYFVQAHGISKKVSSGYWAAWEDIKSDGLFWKKKLHQTIHPSLCGRQQIQSWKRAFTISTRMHQNAMLSTNKPSGSW